MNRGIIVRTLLLATVLAVPGCAKEATGQVAAVVNGEEITLQEINAELGNANIPEGANKKLAQQAALQRIIDRRVIAQAAREDGLDKSPEYLLRQRQLEDALLAQMLAQRSERSMPVPDQAAIDKFISENGGMFANRTIYSLDRIQFARPTDFGRLKILENDHSMAEVEQSLKELGIEFERGAAQVDSLQLGSERLQRIQALPPGEPFVAPENSVVTVAVITGSRVEPVTGAQARPLAVQAMRNKQIVEAMQQRLKSAKASAEIKYQNGFSPPAAPAAKATPPGG